MHVVKSLLLYFGESARKCVNNVTWYVFCAITKVNHFPCVQFLLHIAAKRKNRLLHFSACGSTARKVTAGTLPHPVIPSHVSLQRWWNVSECFCCGSWWNKKNSFQKYVYLLLSIWMILTIRSAVQNTEDEVKNWFCRLFVCMWIVTWYFDGRTYRLRNLRYACLNRPHRVM